MPFQGAIPLLTVLVVGYILPVSEGTTGITITCPFQFDTLFWEYFFQHMPDLEVLCDVFL